MADLKFTAQLLAGADVDEAALEAEIAAADMKGESFFSPAHEQAEGMEVLAAIETQTSGDTQIAERARALLGRAEEIAQNADERELLVARLKHRMEEDGLPEPTQDELERVAKLMRVVHGVEVDVHQPKWEPPRAVLEVDPNALRTADTGPVIGPAAVPAPHVQRRLARKMRDRDRDRDRGRDDTTARADARGAGRTGSGSGARGAHAGATSGGGGAGASGRSDSTHTGARTGTGTEPSATTSTSTGGGSGGTGPNSAHAEVHFHWPPGMTMPTSVPSPAPSAPALDAATVQRMLDDAQRRANDEMRRMVEAAQRAGEQSVQHAAQAQAHQLGEVRRVLDTQSGEVDDVLKAVDDLRSSHKTFKGWLLNTGFGQALIAILLLSGILGTAWWVTKPTEHETRRVSTQSGTTYVPPP